MKKCTRCKTEKTLENFYRIKKSSDGFDLYCKDCRRFLAREYRENHLEQVKQRINKWHEQHREQSRSNAKKSYKANKGKNKKLNQLWWINNRDKVLKQQRENRRINKDKVNTYQREWVKNNPDKKKQYQKRYAEKNKEQILKASLIYRESNKEKCKERITKWTERNKGYIQKRLKKKYKNDIKYRLSRVISANMRQSLKGAKRGRKWESLVGYTINDLMNHLQSKFQPDMDWDNYGEWHIDHKKPIALFNYTSPNDLEFKECWSLQNLQPLWAAENIRKGASYCGN